MAFNGNALFCEELGKFTPKETVATGPAVTKSQVVYRSKNGKLVIAKGRRENFDDYWTPEPNSGCWLWFGSHDGHGYGTIRRGGKLWKAHRWAYMRDKGAIPEGLDLDHLCRNRGCINPDHLEPVTRKENVRRALPHVRYGKAPSRHCRKGHEFTPENTWMRKGKRTGERICKTCTKSLKGHV